ncbi:MAG: 16S rRNA (cytidine(1402)-2'-O)-methyltransferase [bacterium]|nr:16S rRNA (cytidine(1402)-2'-O)-methyltransferase [bacterium]
MTVQPGKIYLVPTPIGNMGDITNRAVEVLEEVAAVACEDTRVTGSLLKKLGLKKKLISYHDFNEAERAAQLAQMVAEGQSVAVATDAGSPGISDPAYRIVRAAIELDLEIVALPGPCAIVPAVTASGLPTDRFFFEGFLSNKSAARKRRLQQLESLEHTLVFYESPHRVQKALADMQEVLGDRQACLAREISKKFEQYIRGNISAIIEQIRDRKVKGEIVLVVAGRSERSKSDD